MSCCSKYSLFFRFSYQNFVCISVPSHACHMLCPTHTPQFPRKIFITRTNYKASNYRNFCSFMSFPIFTLNTLFNTLFLKPLDLCLLFYVTDQVQTHTKQENTTALHILKLCVLDGRQEHVKLWGDRYAEFHEFDLLLTYPTDGKALRLIKQTKTFCTQT